MHMFVYMYARLAGTLAFWPACGGLPVHACPLERLSILGPFWDLIRTQQPLNEFERRSCAHWAYETEIMFVSRRQTFAGT